METLRSILVPIDGSPSSISALDHAVALAIDYGARIGVLHVVPERDLLSPDLREKVHQTMTAAVARARDALSSQLATLTATGDPTREIIRRAREGYDLIVMGTHGRSGRLHELLGSVAEAVVRNAPCPVLTVRDTAEYQSFADRRHHRPALGDTPAPR